MDQRRELPGAHSGTSGALRAQRGQRSQPRHVVSCLRQSQQLVHFLETTNHDLSQRAYRLAPAEALLNGFPFALAQRVAQVPRRAFIDRAAAAAFRVPRHMRRHVRVPASLDEPARVVTLVGPDRDASIWSRDVLQHLGGNVAFGSAIRPAGLYIDHQTVPIVGQHMTEIARQRRCNIALLVQAAFTVALRLVCFIATRFAVPVARRAIIVPAVFTPDALVTGPRMNQGAVHANMLARQQAALMCRFYRRIEQVSHRIELDQPIPFFSEYRVIRVEVVTILNLAKRLRGSCLFRCLRVARVAHAECRDA